MLQSIKGLFCTYWDECKWITFIDLCMLNHSCILGMRSTCSSWIIFLLCCWIQFTSFILFYWELLNLCSYGLLICNFLFRLGLCMVLVTGIVPWTSTLQSKFRSINSSLKVSQNSGLNPSDFGVLLIGRFFMTAISLGVIGLLKLLISSWLNSFYNICKK